MASHNIRVVSALTSPRTIRCRSEKRRHINRETTVSPRFRNFYFVKKPQIRSFCSAFIPHFRTFQKSACSCQEKSSPNLCANSSGVSFIGRNSKRRPCFCKIYGRYSSRSRPPYVVRREAVFLLAASTMLKHTLYPICICSFDRFGVFCSTHLEYLPAYLAFAVASCSAGRFVSESLFWKVS